MDTKSKLSKEEKYLEFLKDSTLANMITCEIVANEILARALLSILIKKGIISSEEYRAAIKKYSDEYIERKLNGSIDSTNIPDEVEFWDDTED